MLRHGFMLVWLIFGFTSVSFAQSSGHRHPPSDVEVHDKFYSTWTRPNTFDSCCNKQDCYPTKAYFDQKTGAWFAFIRETKRYEQIPLAVYDQRNPPPVVTPDNNAHVCAVPDRADTKSPSRVFCFVPPPPDV